eukprot:COSAG05_NODE_4940_length_1319_cov_0.863934_1_plen_220_part_00
MSCAAGPKRAQTSYFLFVAAERDAVKEANPDASVTDITKILGSRWGQMDDAAKAPYEQKAAADKVRYAEELKAWQAAHPDEVAAMDAQGKSGRAAKKKQKTGPKRATTAYFYFTADMRERVKEENPSAYPSSRPILIGILLLLILTIYFAILYYIYDIILLNYLVDRQAGRIARHSRFSRNTVFLRGSRFSPGKKKVIPTSPPYSWLYALRSGGVPHLY